jgi:hypothetical protein
VEWAARGRGRRLERRFTVNMSDGTVEART